MKHIALLTIAAIFLFSCNQGKLDQLSLEKDSLRLETDRRDSIINTLFQSFNQIEENLATIREKEGLISQNTQPGAEIRESVQQRISNDIEIINELMIKNREAIQELNRKLKRANIQLGEFEKMVQRLKLTIAEKDEEIEILTARLSDLNIYVGELTAQIDTLKMSNQQKTAYIEQQAREMNTAYYVMGSRRELIEQNILSREGGFIGIGRTSKLKADAELDYFNKIDISRSKEILINHKKIKLITSHPSGSFRLDGNEKIVNSLVILSPEKFWSASRFLVIEFE
jgi:DNA repair exonuclease SbcCD ATPase subunit